MPVGPDERAVDERVAAVGVAHERQRQVRAVVEVDREPVPAAAADGDEVAPLVVEPGGAVDRTRRRRRASASRPPSSRSASSSTSRRPARSRSSRRGRAAPAAWSRPAGVEPEAAGAGRGRLVRARLGREVDRVRPMPAIVQAGGRRSRVGRVDAGQRQVEPGRSPSRPGRPIDLRRRPPAAGRSGSASPVSSVMARCDAHDVGKRAALGAEDDVLEAEAARPSAGPEVAGVVPPLGQAVVRRRRRAAGRRAAGRRRPRRWRGRRRDGRARRRRVGEDRAAGRCRRRPATASGDERRAAPGARSSAAIDGRLGLGLGGRQPVGDQPFEPGRHPPVPAAEQAHRRRAPAGPGRRSRRGRPRSPSPSPSALMRTMSAKANEPATTTTMSAADVTIRPLRSRPRATASVLSPVRSQTSFIRDSRKTS